MARLCELCGSNLDKYGDRHRCIGGKIAGQRKPTKLEAERIARGEMSPADLIPKPKEKAATVQANAAPRGEAQPGRLAPRLRPLDTSQPLQPQASQPTLAAIMAAIGELRSIIEAMRCSCKASKGTE